MEKQDDYYILLDYTMKNIVIPFHQAYQGLSDSEKREIDRLLKSEGIFKKIKNLVKK